MILDTHYDLSGWEAPRLSRAVLEALHRRPVEWLCTDAQLNGWEFTAAMAYSVAS